MQSATPNISSASSPLPVSTGHQPNQDSHTLPSQGGSSNRGHRSKNRPYNRKPKGSNKMENSVPQVAEAEGKSGTVTAVAKKAPERNNGNQRSSFTCPICLQESSHSKDQSNRAFHSANFPAVGPCDHPVCTLCALRMRSKSRSYECSLCKATSPFMVVCSITAKVLSIKFFDLLQNIPCHWPLDLTSVDLIDVQHPDCRIDLENKIIYFQCPEFYQHMENLKSLHCPVRNCSLSSTHASIDDDQQSAGALITNNGGTRFRSVKQLLHHLQKDHQGMTMCALCLEHRPLFISEHELFYNMHKYKQHLAGNSPMTAGHSSVGKGNSSAYNLGHPECKLCKENFFDLNALYKHMNTKHYSCSLCDQALMFRYYKDIGALREHHSQAHYVCTMCHSDPSIRNSDILYAFKLYTEFMYHMKGFHHISDVQRYLMGDNSNRKPSHLRNDIGIQYQDLHMGTASPHTGPTSNISSHAMINPHRDRMLSQIPSNMTIAGRVTGTGRFSALHGDEAQALQSLIADNQHQLTQNTLVDNENPEQFPSLHTSRTAATPSTSVNFASIAAGHSSHMSRSSAKGPALTSESASSISIHEVHPLSVLNRKPAPKTSLSSTAKSDAAPEPSDSAQPSRAQLLADAFGLPSDRAATIPSTPFHPNSTVNHRVYQFLSRHQEYKLAPQFLAAYLYPGEVINWARRNKVELVKIENKLTNFIQPGSQSASASQNSLQFKPMTIGFRQILHIYAKYLQCNSYEYDHEPRRYVSYVKKTESCLPALSLSSASSIASVNISTEAIDDQGCAVYFMLREGVYSNWIYSTDQTKSYKKENVAFNLSQLLVVDLIESLFQAVHKIKTDYEEIFDPYKHVTPLAYSTSLYYTLHQTIYQELLENNIRLSFRIESIAAAGPNGIAVSMNSKYAATIISLYLQTPAFWESMGDLVTLELLRYYSITPNFPLPSLIEPVLNSYEVTQDTDVELDQDKSVAEDDEGFVASEYVLVDGSECTGKGSHIAAADDWEDIAAPEQVKGGNRAEEDEWESYLATKRNAAESAVPRYIPKRTNTLLEEKKEEPKTAAALQEKPKAIIELKDGDWAVESRQTKAAVPTQKQSKEATSSKIVKNRFDILLGDNEDEGDSEDGEGSSTSD